MRIELGQSVERLASAFWSALGLVVATATARLLLGIARTGPGAAEPRPDELVLAALAWLGVGLAVWLALGCALALASNAPGALGRTAALLADRITPTVLRKVLTLLLGASVGSLALPPALVSSAGTTPVSTRTGWGPAAPSQRSAGTPQLGPGYVPTGATAVPITVPMTVPMTVPTIVAARPATGRNPTPTPGPGPGFRPTPPVPAHDDDAAALLTPRPRPTTASHALITVHRGDTLWSIARRHLGPGSSDAEVCREWPRWYAANRAVIGDDPDLIRAGLQLVPPPAPVGHPMTPTEE